MRRYLQDSFTGEVGDEDTEKSEADEDDGKEAEYLQFDEDDDDEERKKEAEANKAATRSRPDLALKKPQKIKTQPIIHWILTTSSWFEHESTHLLAREFEAA